MVCKFFSGSADQGKKKDMEKRTVARLGNFKYVPRFSLAIILISNIKFAAPLNKLKLYYYLSIDPQRCISRTTLTSSLPHTISFNNPDD